MNVSCDIMNGVIDAGLWPASRRYGYHRRHLFIYKKRTFHVIGFFCGPEKEYAVYAGNDKRH